METTTPKLSTMLTPRKWMDQPDLVINTGTGKAYWIKRTTPYPNRFNLEVRSKAGMLTYIAGRSALKVANWLEASAGQLESEQFMDWYKLN